MAYVKLSSEYLTHLLPDEAERRLTAILSQLGALESVSYTHLDVYKRQVYR